MVETNGNQAAVTLCPFQMLATGNVRNITFQALGKVIPDQLKERRLVAFDCNHIVTIAGDDLLHNRLLVSRVINRDDGTRNSDFV